MSQKKKWSSSAKLKIALEALKHDKTISDICHAHKVAPSQVHAWKKHLLDEGAKLFEGRPNTDKREAKRQEQLQAQLYKKIGELTVERDFLDKAWSNLQHQDGI